MSEYDVEIRSGSVVVSDRSDGTVRHVSVCVTNPSYDGIITIGTGLYGDGLDHRDGANHVITEVSV